MNVQALSPIPTSKGLPDTNPFTGLVDIQCMGFPLLLCMYKCMSGYHCIA